MFLQRNKLGRLQQVRKPKDKEKLGGLKPTGTIHDPPIRIDPGEPLPLSKEVFDASKGKAPARSKNTRLPDRSHKPAPNNTRLPDRSRRPHVSNATKLWVDTVSAADRYLPREGPEDYARDQEPELRPPAPEPPRGPRRPEDRRAPDRPHGVRRPAKSPAPDAEDEIPDREPELLPPGPKQSQRTPRQARLPSPDSGHHPPSRERILPPPDPNRPQKTPRQARPPNPGSGHHSPNRKEQLPLPSPNRPQRTPRRARRPSPDPGHHAPSREEQLPPPGLNPPRRTPRRAGSPSPGSGHHAPNRGKESPGPTLDPPRRTRRPAKAPASTPPNGARRPARPPSPDPGHHPPSQEGVLLPPTPETPRRTPRQANSPARTTSKGTRRTARPPTPETAAYRSPFQRFDSKPVFIRDPAELFAEASKDISLKTGTKYPCKQKDLDMCGGNFRRTSRTRDHAQLRAMWFSRPNKGLSVSIKTAARDIFEHNDTKRTGRTAPVKEQKAIDRLLAMLKRACQEPWGPDLAIKTFCDLDAVFFDGRLRGHVCITWADVGEFPERNVFGHTIFLGQGKAVIQLNAQFVFFDWGVEDGRLFAQMFATVLHEMVHAYQFVSCPQHGKEGWLAANTGKSGGHDKNFGTMMLAVNTRAFDMLGLRGDPTRYPCHEYAKREGTP